MNKASIRTGSEGLVQISGGLTFDSTPGLYRELRVEAVLRRSQVGQEQARRLSVGDVEIDTENLSGKIGDEEIQFTKREIEVLCFLAENSDRPVSRDELLARVWGYARGLEIETRTVDIHIAKLRRKIEADPKQPQVLITVRGAGYRLVTS